MTALVAIGSNLPAPEYATPRETCEAALEVLEKGEFRIVARSRWYRSAPVPPSDQPWFVNGVVRLDVGGESPEAVLSRLHAIEAAFGRRRGRRNAARTLDLDLLDMDGMVRGPDAAVWLPHPRLQARAFVLLPLREVAPGWRHPVTGISVTDLVAALGPEDVAEPLD